MRKLLHLASGKANPKLFPTPFRESLKSVGELKIIEGASSLSEAEIISRIRGCEVLLTGWGVVPIPVAVAKEPGSLRYICNLTGSLRSFVPREVIQGGIPVTNWGDAPAFQVAEGAFALLLACLKNFRLHIEEKRGGAWRLSNPELMGTLRGLRLGLYGFGVIGRQFYQLCQPFQPEIRIFDPFIPELPEGAIRVDILDELFANSDAIAIHAGLTPETRHSVGAAQLALLPEHGILVNTARGGIIDQKALFAELEAGRLRAGLDVLDAPDFLPPDHPARHWPNLILTSHQVEGSDWRQGNDRLLPLHEVAIDNLRRYDAGEPLRFVMDLQRYDLST